MNNGTPLDDLDEQKQSNLERAFVTEWRRWGRHLPDPVAEHRFDDTRRRFDFAWPGCRVAIELQGGTWIGGAHTRGTGYNRDCHKLNDAQLAGWILLWFTTDMLCCFPIGVIDTIGLAIEKRRIDVHTKIDDVGENTD